MRSSPMRIDLEKAASPSSCPCGGRAAKTLFARPLTFSSRLSILFKPAWGWGACLPGPAAKTMMKAMVRTQIETGRLEGRRVEDGAVEVYLGIPFARPPIGELRWRAPQPAERWTGVRPATDFGSRPIQAAVYGDLHARAPAMSEDCLYLNVWKPAGEETTGRPVLLYYYGGGFIAGDGSEPRYDGASMARRGLVVVTCNYRLNLFGFLAHAELSREAAAGGSGNYGLLDQQAALRWVYQNIVAFGGDPRRITIAGESAGSISVSLQMASPPVRDLIAGAIGESGAAIQPTFAPVSVEVGEQIGATFFAEAGWPSVAHARALDTAALFDAYLESSRRYFPLVIDGSVIPRPLVEIYAAGEQAQVPLLVGWNSTEMAGMAFMEDEPYSRDHYMAKLRKAFPRKWREALALYPADSAEQIEWSATALASDRFIAYSTWKWFDLHRRTGGQPTFRYLYAKRRPPLRDRTQVSGLAGGTRAADADAPPPFEPIGAPHACEIEYCLGNLDLIDEFAWTAEDHAVSRVMQAYFANFVRAGDPNGSGLPAWPAVAAAEPSPPVLVLDVTSAAQRADGDDRYRFLDRFYGNDRDLPPGWQGSGEVRKP